jgi:hypothetical protein
MDSQSGTSFSQLKNDILCEDECLAGPPPCEDRRASKKPHNKGGAYKPKSQAQQ